MAGFDAAARDFLGGRRIAVVGVSRSGQGVGNVVYRKLRASGHEVVAVNPSAEEVEGDCCYPSLRAVPAPALDGVFVATHPSVTAQVVEECAAVGIRRVWIHRSFGQGSVSAEALQLAARRGLEVIAGGCPMMVCEPVDVAHRCMKWVLRLTGGLPHTAGGAASS